MLTPKKQLADILTKGSFSLDEWNHLLRLFNVMSFSMYSCSHFSDFSFKQSALPKRGQKTTSKESAPSANARPCFVARDPRSEDISSQSLGSLVNPHAIRFKIRNRVLSIESTRECHNGLESAGGRINSKHTVMIENILNPIAQGDLC